MTRGLAMAAFAVADAGGARARMAIRRSGPSPTATVDVAVSIVHSNEGRVLLAERTARQISAGFWELPGGKIEPGETPQQAAARELAEEVGITAQALRPWIVYEHAFPRKRVRLHFFRVDRWTGNPHGREGQRLAWVDAALPHVGPVLASNDRALTALGLPGQIIVTPGGDLGLAHGFAASLREALERGVRLVAVREPQLSADQRVAFARRIVELARSYEARVVLTGSVIEARRAGATGLYSTCADVGRFMARPPVGIWAVSCSTAGDLNRAVALGADLAVLQSDVADHTGAPQSELDKLRPLYATLPIAVYAPAGPTLSMPPAERTASTGIIVQRIDGLQPANVS